MACFTLVSRRTQPSTDTHTHTHTHTPTLTKSCKAGGVNPLGCDGVKRENALEGWQWLISCCRESTESFRLERSNVLGNT